MPAERAPLPPLRMFSLRDWHKVLVRVLARACAVSMWLRNIGSTGGRLQPVLMRPTPQLSVKTWEGGAGGSSGGGGGLGGVGGGFRPWGEFLKVGGLAREPLLPHAYLLGGGCLGVWGYGGMYAIIALSRPCSECRIFS